MRGQSVKNLSLINFLIWVDGTEKEVKKRKAEMRVRKRERDQVNERNITTGKEGGKVKKKARW